MLEERFDFSSVTSTIGPRFADFGSTGSTRFGSAFQALLGASVAPHLGRVSEADYRCVLKGARRLFIPLKITLKRSVRHLSGVTYAQYTGYATYHP